MKIIKQLTLLFIILVSFSSILVVNAAPIDININSWQPNTNLETWNIKDSNGKINDHLDNLNDWGSDQFTVWIWWEKWFRQTLFNIAKDLKNIFFMIAWLYFLILVARLIFTENTDEEVWKFKKWIVWISIWLIITQIAYSFVKVLYDNNISEWLANTFTRDIIYPLIKLLELWASFFFVAIAIYAFFRMISANWDEEKVKTWRMSILYSIIWFVVIKTSRAAVDTIYWKVDCNNSTILWFIEVSNSNCVIQENLNGAVKIIADIINWSNSIIWIVILILIIYTWVQVIFSVGDEEVLKKAKKSILYIILWILLLFINYMILTFFIIPETAIN